jgi:hypothetical protein
VGAPSALYPLAEVGLTWNAFTVLSMMSCGRMKSWPFAATRRSTAFLNSSVVIQRPRLEEVSNA